MDTDHVKFIDWSKHATYKDLSKLLVAYAEGFRNADVTSGTGDFVDGHVKRGVLERMEQLAQVFDNTELWLIVREERDYSPGQGSANN